MTAKTAKQPSQNSLQRLELLREAAQLNKIATRPNEPGGHNEAVEAIFAKGVSINFLCKVFRMAPATVREKLARCTPIPGTGDSGEGKQRNYRYDLADAAAHLVMPKLTPEQVLNAVKTSDLPASFQQQFWNAQLRRQEWEERAKDLWRTEKVRDVLGSTFQTMKFTMQLWLDVVEREKGLTDPQREILQRLVDGLQRDIYEALVANVARGRTEPMLTEDPAGDMATPAGDPADDLI